MTTISNVKKLREITNAGMLDCKNALEETNGDLDKAIEVIRKKGKLISEKRADKKTSEGVVVIKTNDDNTNAIMLSLACETDFVANNEDFKQAAKKIVDFAAGLRFNNLEELCADNGVKGVLETITTTTKEKVIVPAYEFIEAPQIAVYLHHDGSMGAIVGFNKVTEEIEKLRHIAMVAGSMNPIAINIEDVPEELKKEVYQQCVEKAAEAGKPRHMIDKIAEGMLNKRLNSSCLDGMTVISENIGTEEKPKHPTVSQLLSKIDKELKITTFKIISLRDD